MNVICWISTYWPFSPSLVLLHNSTSHECVSCYFWPGRSSPKLSQHTLLFNPSPSSLYIHISPYGYLDGCWIIIVGVCGSCGKLSPLSPKYATICVCSCKIIGSYKSMHVGLSSAADIWNSTLAGCLREVNKCEPLHVSVDERERVYVCMFVQQMSCALLCSPDWLVFVAAPSCRRAWPRASLSARTNPASATVICQLQRPSHALNNTHSLTGSASVCLQAWWRCFTHAYLPFFFFLSRHPHTVWSCNSL